MYKMFLKKEDINPNSTIRVRYSDNVLDENDWTVCELTIKNNIVTNVQVINPGVYNIDNLIGSSIDDLVRYNNNDPTGDHPEQYFEIET